MYLAPKYRNQTTPKYCEHSRFTKRFETILKLAQSLSKELPLHRISLIVLVSFDYMIGRIFNHVTTWVLSILVTTFHKKGPLVLFQSLYFPHSSPWDEICKRIPWGQSISKTFLILPSSFTEGAMINIPRKTPHSSGSCCEGSDEGWSMQGDILYSRSDLHLGGGLTCYTSIGRATKFELAACVRLGSTHLRVAYTKRQVLPAVLFRPWSIVVSS